MRFLVDAQLPPSLAPKRARARRGGRTLKKLTASHDRPRLAAGRDGWIRISKAGHVPEFFADVALGYT